MKSYVREAVESNMKDFLGQISGLSHRARMRAGAILIDTAFQTLARAGRYLPAVRPLHEGIEVIKDVSYDPMHPELTLDVYRPEGAGGGLPVVLYVHGGGFRILSKETHWLCGLIFANRGYVVCNINYRLAPAAKYPAAIMDCCQALQWVGENVAAYGGDAERLVLAGESAGGNLVTALALAHSHKFPETWAQKAFDAEVQIAAVMAACGIFEVSNYERFLQNPKLAWWVSDRLVEVAESYLADVPASLSRDLADPLIMLESDAVLERSLPPFYIPCGTSDPLLDDSRRLSKALAKRGVPELLDIYPGEFHAFHMLAWRPVARRCWRKGLNFIGEYIKD